MSAIIRRRTCISHLVFLFGEWGESRTHLGDQAPVSAGSPRRWGNRHSYCPRSVHTHFQGLWVVFGLLIYIPSARLTEHCCSHLLWLCESAESDLLPRFVRGKPCKVTSPLLHSALTLLVTVVQVQFVVLPSYTYIIPHFWWFVKGFLQFSCILFENI